MNLRKALLFGAAILCAFSCSAQSGSIKTYQINTTYYVGQVNGFYGTIQSAVTKACGIGAGTVNIPSGATPGDTIAGVTGGCSGVGIVDERTVPPVNYAWSGSVYAAVSSAGSVLPTPQNRLFIQPNAGTQAVAGPAVTGVNAVAPFMQGSINPDLYANGGGNNGISNAIASADCVTAGCFFARPFTSVDTENISTALNSASEYTHGLDSTYGTAQHYFHNAGINAAGQGGRFANPTTCFWNDTDLTSNSTHDCQHTYMTVATNGIDVGSPWQTSLGHTTDMYAYTRGITQMQDSNTYCFHVGDCMSKYNYLWYRGGTTATNDESIKGIDQQVHEVFGPYGTIITGGANATVIQSNFTTNAGNQGDGYNLVSTSEVMAAGLITGETNAPVSGNAINSITTSDTHAVSTGYGTLGAACGTNVSRAFPVSQTCSITVVSGSFSAAANATVCVGDYRYPEQASITAVGTGTITVGLTYSHPSGTPIYQGGGCGGKLALGYGLTDPFSTHKFTSYFIAGSLTSTTFDYVSVHTGGQDGKQVIPIPGVIQPVGIYGLTRTGNVVTASIVNSAGYPLNNFVAPSGAAIVVSGATPSDLNGTVTGVTATANTMTWNQTGANESGSGGTISVTGYNNYSVACGAETTMVKGVTLRADNIPTLDGTLQVEPNNCLWAAGSAVTQPNHQAAYVEGEEFDLSGDTIPRAFPNTARVVYTGGKAWSAGIENQSLTDDLWSAMQGGGGTIIPRTYLLSSNFYSVMFDIKYPPVNGGKLFLLGCPVDGCNSTYDYGLIEADGAKGASRFKFTPSSGAFWMDSPFYASNVAGSYAIGINGYGSPLAPGTAGFGGWLTGVGDYSQSTSYKTLVLGNGNVGDSSGTFGANTAYIPNLNAGVATPVSLGVFTTGAAGTTTYTYACTAVTPNGETPAITHTITTGNATLSGTNYNYPKCYGVAGATSLNIYRLVGGATTGLIGTEPNSAENSSIPFHDTGLVGNGAVPPVTNTTGKFMDFGVVDGCATFTSSVLGSTGNPCGSGTTIPKGRAILVAGTVTVSSTAATTSGNYTLTNCGAAGTAIGVLSVGTVTAGTSFVINSLTATNTVATGDTSTVCWMIQ